MVEGDNLSRHERRAIKRSEREERANSGQRKRQAGKIGKNMAIYGGVVLVLIAAVFGLSMLTRPAEQSAGPGQYDSFAQCLSQKGAIMYGTEWCPHCKAEKANFGSSFQYVNYVDCDASRGACDGAGITGYPTWTFSDGSRASGTQGLYKLSEKTGCTL